MRNLRLSRIFALSGNGTNEVNTFKKIYSWAKESKLYRLSDAALYALANIDKQKTTAACQECMTPPIPSKILAIASIRLLKDLDWDIMEPSVVALLGGSEDPHILLNLLDALLASGFSLKGDATSVLLEHLRTKTEKEVLTRVAKVLAEKASFGIFETLKDIYHQSDQWRQCLIMSIIARMIVENRVANKDVLTEFLYQILRKESCNNQTKAAALLWRMGDDYSSKVIRDFIMKGDIEEQVDIVMGLQGALRPDIIPVLFTLMEVNHSPLQVTLRETLLSDADEDTKNSILDMALGSRGESSLEHEGEDGGSAQIRVDFFKEKSKWK